MLLTDLAKNEIEALKQIFSDEIHIKEHANKIELRLDLSSSIPGGSKIKEKNPSDLPLLGIVLSIDTEYPKSPPCATIEGSNYDNALGSVLLDGLGYVIENSSGDEILFSLMNHAVEIVEKYYEDAAKKSKEEPTIALGPEEPVKRILNEEAFKEWEDSLHKEAVDSLKKYESQGLSKHESYWKLPQYMRAMLYIYKDVPKHILIPDDLEGQWSLTGRQSILQKRQDPNAEHDDSEEDQDPSGFSSGNLERCGKVEATRNFVPATDG